MATTDPKRTDVSPKWSLAGAVAAAVGASVCCVGPLLLLALGVGGAWIGNLTAMEKYRPIWTAATLVFLGLAYVRAYRKRKEEACAPGASCPTDAGRRNKVLFWIVTAFVLGLLALPYAIPYAFAGSVEESPAVRNAKVTLDPPRAVVTYDRTRTTVDRLIETTTRAGFPSTVLQEGETP
jgi:mercuric ion transport protein